MADITLGQSIAGSLTSSDPRLDGRFFDDYDLKGIDGFRQVEIVVDRAPLSPTATIQLINTATNAVVAQNFSPVLGSFFLDRSTFPGLNYKVRLLSGVVEDYSITIKDLGKAQSIVSNTFDVGTVGDSGIFSPLITPVSSSTITDIAGNLQTLGAIYLDKKTSIEIDKIKKDLRQAVDRGLQIAIFNCCSGLGLSQELADLNIPYLIVMRSQISDQLAQQFCRDLLLHYSQGYLFTAAFDTPHAYASNLQAD
jgi:hypothetical protein